MSNHQPRSCPICGRPPKGPRSLYCDDPLCQKRAQAAADQRFAKRLIQDQPWIKDAMVEACVVRGESVRSLAADLGIRVERLYHVRVLLGIPSLTQAQLVQRHATNAGRFEVPHDNWPDTGDGIELCLAPEHQARYEAVRREKLAAGPSSIKTQDWQGVASTGLRAYFGKVIHRALVFTPTGT